MVIFIAVEIKIGFDAGPVAMPDGRPARQISGHQLPVRFKKGVERLVGGRRLPPLGQRAD
jgi:hypothetical protein